MTVEEARQIVLDMLVAKGKAANRAMLEALGGNSDLLQDVREDLILDNLAQDRPGGGLVYTGSEVSGEPAGLETTAAPVASDNCTLDSVKLVFISYGHDDEGEELLRKLRADLEHSGACTPATDHDFKYGDNWRERVQEFIKDASRILVVLTDHSVRTGSIAMKEVAYALECQKTVVPLRTRALSEPIPLHLQDILYIDFSRGYGDALAGLLSYLSGEQAAPLPPPVEEVYSRNPLPIGPGIRQHLEAFTGREWLLSRLDAWMDAEHPSPAFVLIGGPGIGKSAIAARLTVLKQDRVVAIHFCSRDNYKTLDPHEFTAALVAQFREQVPGYRQAAEDAIRGERPRTAVDAFHEAITVPMHRVSAPKGVRLIVIDALDEAERSGSRETIADVLASQVPLLPPWLRIFVTTRPVPGVVAKLAALGSLELKADEADNLRDVSDYIKARLAEAPLAEDLGPQAGAVGSELEKLAAGNFLYAKLALDDLRAGRLDPAHLTGLPPGLRGYYLTAFTRLFSPDLFKSDFRPLLRALAVAYDPLPFRLLGQLAGMTTEQLNDRLLLLRPYLRTQGQGNERRYSLFHKSLQEALVESGDGNEYWCDPETGHSRLADALWAHWREHEYAVRYLPAHLRAAGRQEDLIAVLTDLEFLTAALEWDEFEVKAWIARLREERPELSLAETFQAVLDAPQDYVPYLKRLAFLLEDMEGRYDLARDLHRQRVKHYREAGDLDQLQEALGHQGIVEENYSEHEALRLYEEQERICRQLEQGVGLWKALNNRGRVLSRRGDTTEAMALYEEAEGICRRLGDKYGLMHVKGNQAICLPPDQALVLLQEAADLAVEVGYRSKLQEYCRRMAGIYLGQGELAQALELFERANQIARYVGDENAVVDTGLLRLLAELEQGESDT